MTQFRIKRVYEPASPEDGFRVLVDRLWPRGMRREALRLDLWARELTPSDGLRRPYRPRRSAEGVPAPLRGRIARFGSGAGFRSPGGGTEGRHTAPCLVAERRKSCFRVAGGVAACCVGSPRRNRPMSRRGGCRFPTGRPFRGLSVSCRFSSSCRRAAPFCDLPDCACI